MHDALVSGPHLHSANVLRFLHVDGNDKIPEHVAAARRQLVRLGQLHNQIGRTQLPPLGEMRLGRQIRGISLEAARLHPIRDQAQLGVREATLARKVAIAGLRQPGWHESALGDGNDLRRMLAHVLVSQQRKWRGLSRAVTGRTILKYQRGDLLIEGDRITCGQECNQ